jgi:hypothetical protein
MKIAIQPIIDYPNTPIQYSFQTFNDYISKMMTAGSDMFTAFFNSLLIILVTEIGDKTFFIAAILGIHGYFNSHCQEINILYLFSYEEWKTGCVSWCYECISSHAYIVECHGLCFACIAAKRIYALC